LWMFLLQKIREMLNREGAKGFIYFLIGTDDQKKNHDLTRKDQRNAEPRLNTPQYDLPDLRGKLRCPSEFNRAGGRSEKEPCPSGRVSTGRL